MSVKELLKSNPKKVFEEYFPNLSGKTGQELVSCPFHEDKNPSFSVNLENGVYKCFSCGESGNAFKLVKKLEKLSDSETFQKLESIYGVSKVSRNVQVRYIAKNKKPKSHFYTKEDLKLREVSQNDLINIQNELGKKYSSKTFEALSEYLKISVNPYGLAFSFPPNSKKNLFFNPNNCEKVLVLEGRTDFMTAVELGLESEFGIFSRFNKTAKVKLDGNETFFVMDEDDTEENLKTHLFIESETKVRFTKLPEGFKDLSDWFNASYLDKKQVLELFENCEAKVLESFQLTQETKEISQSETTTPGKFLQRKFAKEFQKKHNWHSYNDIHFVYKDGVYKEIESDTRYNLVGDELQEISEELASDSRIRSTLAQTERLSKRETSLKSDFINLRNGLYDVYNSELIPHTEEIFSIHQIQIDYDEKAKAPRFLDLLKYAHDGNQEIIQAIQRFFGYCLLPVCDDQKAMWFFGVSRSSKSVLAKILMYLIGKQNTALIGLDALDPKKNFGLMPIVNKQLVWMDEIDSYSLPPTSLQTMKKLIANTPFEIRRPFSRQEISVTPNAKWLFTTNPLPKFKDNSSAFYERLILIPFFNRVKDENKILGYEKILLREEGPGILNWILEGALAYLEKGLIEPKISTEFREEHKNESNPIYHFCKENFILGEGGFAYTSEIYERYKDFREDEGEQMTYSRRALTSTIKELLRNYRVTTGNPGGKAALMNVKLRGNENTLF